MAPLKTEITPLFICGLNRMGTTLLTALFDGHPQLIVAPNESRFFTTFYPQAKQLSESDRLDLAQNTLLRIWHVKGPYYQKYLSSLSSEDYLNAFTEQWEKSAKHIQDYLFVPIITYGLVTRQVQPETKYWVEKTPENEHYTHLFFEW